MKWSVWMLVLGLSLVGAGCKRRQPPPDAGRRRGAAARPRTPRVDAGAKARAESWPQLSPSDPARYQRVFKVKRGPRGDVDPVRADKESLGFPVPEGLKPVTARRKKKRRKFSKRFASPYSVRSLRRFFRRELGRTAKIENRRFGFKVEDPTRRGFIMVTQPPGYSKPVVSVVRPPVNRPRLPGEDLAPN